MLNKILHFLSPKKTSEKKWEKNEYFDPNWKTRIKEMAVWIKPNESVVDLGCGQNWLMEFLPANCSYVGVDYTTRNDKTIVCNFNTDPFPIIKGDCAFVSGCLEYILEPEKFISSIADQYKKCIISYCTLEKFPNRKLREDLFWKNNLTKNEFLEYFKKYGYTLEQESITCVNTSIFLFTKK